MLQLHSRTQRNSPDKRLWEAPAEQVLQGDPVQMCLHQSQGCAWDHEALPADGTLLRPAEMQVRDQENQHFCFVEDFEPFFPLMKYVLSPLFSLQYLFCIQQVFETTVR